MSTSPRSRRRARSHHPRGNALTFSLAAAAVVAALGVGGWWMLRGGEDDDTLDLITNTVSKGAYDYVVIEQGTVESATNTELRCEVKSRGGGGGSSGGDRGGGSGMGGGSVAIIDLPVPEGTIVKEGDIVVRLDSSALEQEEITQQTKVNSQRLVVEQANITKQTAEYALREYLEGTFKSQEKGIEARLFAADQVLTTAMNQLDSTKKLHEKGIVNVLQVEGAQYQYANALKQREVVVTELETLRTYTKAKMRTQLENDIKTAEAKVGLEKANLLIEEGKLKEIGIQKDKCIIRAPTTGQVVFANEYDSFRGSSQSQFIVAEGVMVRERQVIIRLPNVDDMQVKATVNESRVTLVRPGLPVTIRVDALRDEVIEGVVTKVNQYAEASSYSSGNIKRYATFVKILNPPQGLRVGMNAEVRIHVERMPDVLQVPVQALAEVKGHYFTLVWNGTRYETREVKIGSTNDKVATITEGLKDGDQVVMNPRAAGDLLELPNLPDPTPVATTEIKRNEPGDVKLISGPPPGEGGGPGGGGKGKKGGLTPATLVERAMQNDENTDGKLSADEIAKIDERGRRWLDGADKNSDGFVEKAEMFSAAAAFVQQMGNRGGGKRGGGGEGGPPGGPAGGGE